MNDNDIIEIKNYFKRLQRIINDEYTLRYFKYRLVKNEKISDIFCCICVKMPNSYLNATSNRLNNQKYKSILSYNLIDKMLKKVFFLNKDLIVVNIKEANALIQQFLSHFENDLKEIEKNNY